MYWSYLVLSGSRHGVKVTDHLFSDQPVGIDLDVVVNQCKRQLKSGETKLQWRRGYYGKAVDWHIPPPGLEVSNARRKKCLGVYTATGKHNGYDLYTNKRGACIFYDDNWKLNEDGSIGAHVYSSDDVSNLPPLGLWSASDGYS